MLTVAWTMAPPTELSRPQKLLTLLGHDVMDVAYDGYQQLKLSGAAHGLEDLRRDLGSQFSRRRTRSEQVPEPA